MATYDISKLAYGSDTFNIKDSRIPSLGNIVAWNLIDESSPNLYKYSASFTNSEPPEDDWYVRIEFNMTWNSNLIPVVIRCSYSNRSGVVYLDLDSYNNLFRLYRTTYNGCNILAIKRIKESYGCVYLKMQKPTEYQSTIQKGSLTVYSPIAIRSITRVDAVDGMLTLKDGYNSNTSFVASSFTGNLIGTADNANLVNNHTVNSDVPANAVFTDTTYDEMSQEEANEGSSEVGKLISAKVLHDTASEIASNIGSVTKYVNGSVVHFEDGADDYPIKDLTVNITPKQDLHGYSNPWPAGGGKNKLPYNLANMKTNNTAGTWSGSVYTYNGITFTVNDDGTVKANGTASSTAQLVVYKEYVNCPFNGYILNGCPSGGSNTKYDLRVSDVDTSSNTDIGSGTTINLTSTGKWQCMILIRSGVTLSNLMFSPMIRLATESDATFAPYSNICPITGWENVKVTRAGKNLLDVNSADVQEAYIDNAGETHANSGWRLSPLIRVDGSKPYVLSGLTSHPNTNIDNYLLYDKYGNKIGYANVSTVSGYPKTFGASIHYVKFSWKATDTSTAQFEQSNTATAYEPYQGTTITIPLGSTVYGGTLNVTTGVLTVDRAFITLTGQESNWNKSSRYVGSFYALLGGNKRDSTSGAVCSHFRAVQTGSADYAVGKFMFDGANNAYINVWFTSENITVDEFKAILQGQVSAGTPVQIAFLLPTPTTVQLTPQQLTSLLGVNNVWSDAGDVSLTYYKDLGDAYGFVPSAGYNEYTTAEKNKLSNVKLFRGTCTTAAATAAKVANTSPTFTSSDLVAGAVVMVSFSNTNTADVSSLTLNVDGTGAKPIKYYDAGGRVNLPNANRLKATGEYLFYYDGTAWNVFLNERTTYSSMSQSEATTGTATTGRLITAKVLNDTINGIADNYIPWGWGGPDQIERLYPDSVSQISGITYCQGMACDGTNIYIAHKANSNPSTAMKISVVNPSTMAITSSHTVGPGHYNNLYYYEGKLYASGGGYYTSGGTDYDDYTKVAIVDTNNWSYSTKDAPNNWGVGVRQFENYQPRNPSKGPSRGYITALWEASRRNILFYNSYITDNTKKQFPLTRITLDYTGCTSMQGSFHMTDYYFWTFDTAWATGNTGSGRQVIRCFSYSGMLVKSFYLQDVEGELEDIWVSDDDTTCYINTIDGRIFKFTLPSLYHTLASSLYVFGTLKPGTVKHVYDYRYGRGSSKSYVRGSNTYNVTYKIPCSDFMFIEEIGDFIPPTLWVNNRPLKGAFWNDGNELWFHGSYNWQSGGRISFAFKFERTYVSPNYTYWLTRIQVTGKDDSTSTSLNEVLTSVAGEEMSTSMDQMLGILYSGGWFNGNIYVQDLSYIVGMPRSSTSLGLIGS